MDVFLRSPSEGGCRSLRGAGLVLKGFLADQLDAESAQAHIGSGGCCQVPNGYDAEVSQNLRTEPHIAPLNGSHRLRRRLAVGECGRWNPGSPLAKVHQDAP